MKFKFVQIIFFAISVSASAATTLTPGLVSVSTSVNTDGSTDIGTFTVRFTLTASGGDVYIPQFGALQSYTDFQGTPATGEIAGLLTGITYTSEGDYFVVLDGESSQFQFTEVVVPSTAGLYSMSLQDLLWFPEAPTATESHLTFDSGYRTSYVALFAPAGAPEPSRAMLVMLGLAGLVLKRRR